MQSAAFELQPNVPVTLSFSARSLDGPATMGWQITPADRETGVKHGLTWGMRGAHPVPITTEWKRYTATFTPNVPQNGFWPRPTYMVQLGDCDKSLLLDAVTVAYNAGADSYLPRHAVEVQVDSPDLPGFLHPSGNTFSKGATVKFVGSVFNPGTTIKTLTLRWQLFDYEGTRSVSAPMQRKVTVPPGKVLSVTSPMKLAATGLVLARFSAIENNRTLDSSDLPVTSLPYRKPVYAKPNFRERYGSSLFGKHTAEITAQLGMRWARWGTIGTRWQDHQPDGPDDWKWPFDAILDEREAMGISNHIVLYGWPKWIMEPPGGNPLPKDMRWKPDDPRWDDLSIQTAWDKFIVGAVNHYKHRSVVFEMANEPEFEWDKHPEEYAAFFTRTARLIKQTAPDAKVMVNNVYGIPSSINARLLARGGKHIDIISWHDYHEGWLSTGIEMQRMKNRLKDLGCAHMQIWFNEGWAYTNTAQDEPALALTNHTAAQSTNAMVASLAELTVNGQEKTIIFHSAYDHHGMSFWDYAGPGQMLWDYNGYPLPLVAAWNTLIHQVVLQN